MPCTPGCMGQHRRDGGSTSTGMMGHLGQEFTRLTQVRKRKNLSQAEVGKKIGINGDAYGRYERNEVKPTIEMAVKIAQALEVSLDFLTGNSDVELDKATLDRVQEVTKLTEKDKDYIFVTLDALIRDFKNKHAYAK
jgi:transcriptional regulator with XRE-family HTH domain